MKYTKLFGKTIKQAPKDEVSVNAKLLARGGFIQKHMAGVYNFLPLGLRVLNKINQIIREEMNAIGGQEMLMSSLQPRDLWERTNRWEDLGKEVMYQFKDHSNKNVGLAITHEEVITEIATHMVSSYKDLPFYPYHIQTKFRDELRARFGLIRCREFLMKDLYSFDISQEAHNVFYEKCREAYLKSFKRIGLPVKVVEASGGVFSKEYSHEFQVLVDSGEDTVLYCDGKNCGFAQNKEIATVRAGDKCQKCAKVKHDEVIKEGKTIEVGNIFHLGTRFSDALGLSFVDEKGNKKPVIMGSYGWGPSRVMGTIVEVYHDERGIIWPEAVAPFQAHLIELKTQKSKVKTATQNAKLSAEDIYQQLTKAGVEVLWDDREDVSAGEKFADADLIGIPVRLVVSEGTLRHGSGSIEWKKRDSDKTEIISLDEAVRRLKEEALTLPGQAWRS